MKGREYYSSVSPKGQITLPTEVRKALGIQPKDQVVIHIEDDTVKVRRLRRLRDFYQIAPALGPARNGKEIEEIAHEDHAALVIREGLE